MSDISQVLDALCLAAFNAVYPSVTFDEAGETFDSKQNFDETSVAPVAAHKFGDGTKFNSGAKFDEKKFPSISGTPIVVYAGWPAQDGLMRDLDLDPCRTHITVFPKAEERNTTRYPDDEQVIIAPAPTLLLTISGPFLVPAQAIYDGPGVQWEQTGHYDAGVQRNTVVRVGGTVSAPQNVALRINSKFYVYSVRSSDTLEGIAAALGALVLVDIAGTSVSGAVITIGPTGRLQAARVGGFGTVSTEIRRQERLIQISIWTNEPQLRDTIASGLDIALARTRFLDLPDGFGARLIYKNSPIIDALQKSNLYRRDLNYLVEYPTIFTEEIAAVIAPSINTNSQLFTI